MFIPSFLSPKGNLAACLFQRLWNIGRFQNRMCQPLWQAVIPRAGSNPDVHSETSQLCAWEREKPAPWKWELQQDLFQRAAWERALTVETASCSLKHTPPLPEMQGKEQICSAASIILCCGSPCWWSGSGVGQCTPVGRLLCSSALALVLEEHACLFAHF